MNAVSMHRRSFLTLLGGGAAAAWPRVARAQQSERVRRVGVLTSYDENDAAPNGWLSGFKRALAELGWTEGRNVRMDVRWTTGSVDRAGLYAKELVGLQPDVILAESTPQTAALQRESRSIPIVFVLVSDPIGSGFVDSLPRPGGNITGFSNHDPTMGGKWLELLTEIAPGIKRVAAMYNPDTAPYVGSYYLPSFEAAARTFKLEPITAPIHNDGEIELAITSLAREPGGGLVLMPDGFVFAHRAMIISLATRNNVPSVNNSQDFVRDGGLLSYGADTADLYRRAAPYVDRILRGARPAELPVQLPVKFAMALNAKTAKALGLTVPASILVRADEVIE
jgi:putative ABC transport system substrate-binding protein